VKKEKKTGKKKKKKNFRPCRVLKKVEEKEKRG
jgi:hypothetical protein